MKNNILFPQLNLLIVNVLKIVKIRISIFNLNLLLKNDKSNITQFLLMIICSLFFNTTLSAQFFETQTYGGTEADAIISVDSDENRNLYVTGTFRQQMDFGQQTVSSNGR